MTDKGFDILILKDIPIQVMKSRGVIEIQSDYLLDILSPMSFIVLQLITVY